MSYSFSFSLVFTSWFTVVPVLKKKATFCALEGRRVILKETVSLIFIYLKRLLNSLKRIFFRIHNYVNKDFYPFSDPRSDSRTLTKRTGLPILQLTVIAFVVSAFVFAIGAFLLDRRLVKVPVFLKALSPVYEDGLSRTNLMLEPVKIY